MCRIQTPLQDEINRFPVPSLLIPGGDIVTRLGFNKWEGTERNGKGTFVVISDTGLERGTRIEDGGLVRPHEGTRKRSVRHGG